MKKALSLLFALVVVLIALLLVRRSSEPVADGQTNVPVAPSTSAVSPAADDAQLAKLDDSTAATIKTSRGTFTMRFYTADAPTLTRNFLELAKRGYYDGLTFHRIVPGFVIQGGDPKGDGTGGESYTGEGLADEAGALSLRHLKGAVAWAKSSRPNSIGSQFYVALDALPQLDGAYSVFGHVVEGLDVVEAIGAIPPGPDGTPSETVTIESVTIVEE